MLAFRQKRLDTTDNGDVFMPGTNISLYKQIQVNRTESSFLRKIFDLRGEPVRNHKEELQIQSEMEKASLLHSTNVIFDNYRGWKLHMSEEVKPDVKIIPLATSNPIKEENLLEEPVKKNWNSGFFIPRINFQFFLSLFKPRPRIPSFVELQDEEKYPWKLDLIEKKDHRIIQLTTTIGKHKVSLRFNDRDYCPNYWILSCKELGIYCQPLGISVLSENQAKMSGMRLIRQKMVDLYVLA